MQRTTLKQCHLLSSGRNMCTFTKVVCDVAMRTLLSIFIHQLAQSDFSSLVNIKTKPRNRLECEADLRCALSATNPRIEHFVSKNSYNLRINASYLEINCCSA